jgi:hypothetical protein
MFRILSILVMSALIPVTVNASLIVNFSDLANNDASTSDGDGTNDTGEKGYQPYEFSFNGGIELDVAGIEADPTLSPSYAYLDKSWTGIGGMGVCTALSGTQCDPGSDDNTSEGETLRLVFSEDVFIESLTINNNHDGGFFGSQFSLNGTTTNIDDSTDAEKSSFDTAQTFDSGWLVSAGTAFDLGYIDRPAGDTSRLNNFYFESMQISAVPEPSIIALFGLGLLGLGFSVRRRQS